MKTALEKGIDYLDDERIDIFYITYDCKKQREYIEHAIEIALQDFGEKIRSKLRNQEDIMILEDIMLKEGLK